ncbi:hypothetical protein SUGI_0907310 [Cryptomeria japonica]|uniref:uncharacterized protein LOC131038269 n=1 Tax=Cryptomeria japonica TaxID=3369 RepID=UPI00241492B1|nr:uncharacterized protein LOC131038269 [Cryptomeria japonica]GLJ43594.1 hypothetical protein SUGI_0907310 [Cryptomeria japonica]
MDMADKSAMQMDIALQVVVLGVALGLMWVLWGGGVPRALARMTGPSRTKIESRAHFVKGAQLLARSRSAKPSLSESLAGEAADEAERAIALNSTDAACHILKGLALERQGHMVAALNSLDTALSPRVVKSLAKTEQSDALFKRAEIRLGGDAKKRHVDAAIADLEAAVALNEKNEKALCLLGTCYEKKGMNVEARRAFQEALKAEPQLIEAKAGLERLS